MISAIRASKWSTTPSSAKSGTTVRADSLDTSDNCRSFGTTVLLQTTATIREILAATNTMTITD
jgi:hypothetical protein